MENQEKFAIISSMHDSKDSEYMSSAIRSSEYKLTKPADLFEEKVQPNDFDSLKIHSSFNLKIRGSLKSVNYSSELNSSQKKNYPKETHPIRKYSENFSSQVKFG